MKRFLGAWFLTLLLAGVAAAQTAIVKRNVNLRPDASTENKPIATLTPPAQLQLLEANPAHGFLHVKTSSEQEGWVSARNVTIQPAATEEGNASSKAPSGTASEISPDWEKPDPQGSVFHGQEGDCGEAGDGGDSVTNPRKNRIDVPADYHLVTWAAIDGLPVPAGAPRNLADWTSDQLAQVSPFQGAAVSLEGYLVKVKVETSSPECCTGASFGQIIRFRCLPAWMKVPSGTFRASLPWFGKEVLSALWQPPNGVPSRPPPI